MGHSSVTTTEIYAKFNLRRLEMEFLSLVISNNNDEKWELGYDNLGYTQNDNCKYYKYLENYGNGLLNHWP